MLEDADLDRMEDGWETPISGLQEDPLDDFDQDGASNLHEYEAGTDPTDDADTPANIPSVIAFTDPADGATYLEGDDINFNVSFSDADFGAERMDFSRTASNSTPTIASIPTLTASGTTLPPVPTRLPRPRPTVTGPHLPLAPRSRLRFWRIPMATVCPISGKSPMDSIP